MSRSRTARKTAHRGAKRESATSPHPALPRWLPPAVYALVTVLLFREFFFAGGLLLGTDTYALSYVARDFYTEFVRQARAFPLWEPYLFGGLPFVEGMHGDIFYPPSLAMFFLDARTMWGWKMVLHVFLAGVFAYLWLRRGLGLGRGAAFFGGLVYMMGADLVSLVYPGGDGKLFVSALAPLLFWLTERAVRRRRASDFALFSLGIALVVFTSHMQLAYFTVWGVSLYFLFRLVQLWRTERRTDAAAAMFGAYTLAGVLGVAAAAVQFVPPLQYLREWSHRADKTLEAEAATGYAYSTSWSLHMEEAVSLVVPEFVGDNVATELGQGNTYWGRNPGKLNHEYAGLVPLLLVPVLLIGRRDPRTFFFIALALLSVLYALGATTPVFRLFYLVPGVNLFRAPSLIIFLYGLSAATLGAMGLQRLIEWLHAAPAGGIAARRALWIAALIFGALALLASAGVVVSVWQALFEVGPDRLAALEANLTAIRLGFWISFLLAAAVAGLWEAATRGLLDARALVLLLAALAAIDLYRVDRPFIRGAVLLGERMADPALFEPDESIRFLLQAQASGEVFRVFDLGAYGWNVLAAHGIEQVTGHHGNEMRTYRRLVGGEAAENVARSDAALLNLLNATYLVVPQRVQDPRFEELFVGSRSAVYRKSGALPRAFLTGTTEVVPDERALERLVSPEFDARDVALLAEALPPKTNLEPDPRGGVEWIQRGANESTLRVTTDRPALLVITDNYHPGWKAELDGTEAAIVRTNLAFRGIPVPAGEHTLHMTYHSEVLQASALTSIAVLLLLLGVTASGWRRRARNMPERAR